MHMTTALQGRQLVIRHSDGENNFFLSLHRALQWALIHDLSKADSYRQQVFQSAYEIVRCAIPKADPLIIPEPEKWPVYKKNLPHILSIARKAREPLPALDNTLEFAMMLNDITSFMWYEGHNDDCQRLAIQTETILDEIKFEELSKIRWDIHVVVGILCSFTGVSRRQEGFNRRNAALRICKDFERRFPDQTESNLTMLCISTADLAWAYVEDEEFDEAERLMQDCAKIYKQLGEEKDLPFHWGRFYHHRFYGKLAKGEYLEAIELVKHAADLQEAHSTVNSTHTQDYRFALGEAIYHAGDIQQALTIHQGVLKARQHLHGEFNSGTMASYFATGMLHWINGDQEQAEYDFHDPMVEEDFSDSCRTNLRVCLEPKRKSHWSEEQRARVNFYLSKLLFVKGETVEARELERQAATVRDKLLHSSERYLRVDPQNERAAYDLMVPMMSMRFTGRHHRTLRPLW
jgi:tetratricopeptide (TPR) repeat protein